MAELGKEPRCPELQTSAVITIPFFPGCISPPSGTPGRAVQGASHSPVALPGMPHVRVVDVVLVSLFIQEIKHVFDGQGQGAATVRSAENGLKEVIDKLLQCTLLRDGGEGRTA